MELEKHSLVLTETVKRYCFKLDFNGTILEYEIETRNGFIYGVHKRHWVKLKNSEKKAIKRFITSYFSMESVPSVIKEEQIDNVSLKE